jgi:GntR family transcriptional regulator
LTDVSACPDLETQPVQQQPFLANGMSFAREVRTLSIEMTGANESECAHLELVSGDQVYRIIRLRCHGSRAFMIEEASLPAALFPNLPELALRSHRLDEIAQAYRLPLGQAEERISVRGASPLAAEALDLAPGTKVLSLERVVRARDGRPAEWRRSECELNSVNFIAG